MILSAKTLARMPAVIDLACSVVFLGPYGQRVPFVTMDDMNEAPEGCHRISGTPTVKINDNLCMRRAWATAETL